MGEAGRRPLAVLGLAAQPRSPAGVLVLTSAGPPAGVLGAPALPPDPGPPRRARWAARARPRGPAAIPDPWTWGLSDAWCSSVWSQNHPLREPHWAKRCGSMTFPGGLLLFLKARRPLGSHCWVFSWAEETGRFGFDVGKGLLWRDQFGF